jgi:hypothetical protein
VAYELFERTTVRVDTPALSIAPQGKVAINAPACRLLIEAGIKTVVILWDKATNRMAIKAAPKGEKNSFTVTFTGGNHSGSFAAKAFLRHIGWNAPKREQLATTWNAAEKMFETTLPPKYLASTSTEGKRRSK